MAALLLSMLFQLLGLCVYHIMHVVLLGHPPRLGHRCTFCKMERCEQHADGQEQQAEVSRIASEDAFNWGYDPVHYGVPEGSYAIDPDSADRVLEYRQMVKVRLLNYAESPATHLFPLSDSDTIRYFLPSLQLASDLCFSRVRRSLDVAFWTSLYFFRLRFLRDRS